MTTFKSALHVCGLSQQQAAEYLGVSLQSVKHWSSGRTQPPRGVWEMLADLFERVQNAADHAADVMALDCINARMWANMYADTGDDQLPHGADSAAGAMALLMVVSAQK